MLCIVWDRDDVLNDLTLNWLENGWKYEHPECSISFDDLVENPPHRILGVELETYLESLDKFRLSELASVLEPIPEVLSWFNKYGFKFRHMVLTSTPLHTAASSSAWTFHHFGKWIQSFHIIPSFRDGTECTNFTSKGEYLHWLGKGDILVDDSKSNIKSASQYGIPGILIPRPWNGNNGSIREALNLLIDSL